MIREVGFVGLGSLGAAIAHRLVTQGIEVHGYDLSALARDRAAALGVAVVDSPMDVARRCETVFVCAPSSAQVLEILFDPKSGLAAYGSAEALSGGIRSVIDLTSGDPAKTSEIVERLGDAGIRYLDSPVSGTGGAGAAADGCLTLLVGASADDLAVHRPVLDLIGSSVHHLGPAGSGHVAKSLNNLLVAAEMILTSEVVVSAMKAGLDPAALVDAIQASSGRNFCTEYRFPEFVLRGNFSLESGGASRLLEKDCAQAVTLARTLGSPMPAGNVIAELVRIAVADYGGELASTNIARLYAQWAGVRFGDGDE
ncbi:NAD(P)-dependent oxidoreductase [Rhodococcus opacus]|uniref:NAD(P)-dependent oxidoreductase n=1 Tax=Rhodococcus opacus TaxID=37919 RepID=A0AAX3YUR8_RHOOP|nr:MULTISPECIES: NAD(P)-dependent oxidoreductase [Rhodococcus]MCZ4586173.1 NAD(P)-dependent oxidoreductase [Rhodococcus opacus]QSE86041.1 NAD(P)-dependent oxidoreductase [Rhodococcus koreensis]WLF51893.1 NAD(P)-dependent oxidoreductase [Rhodococcus opacus]